MKFLNPFSERIPETKPADCLGEECPAFKDRDCEPTSQIKNYKFKGNSSQMPRKSATAYAIYDTVCPENDQTVERIVEVYESEEIDISRALARVGSKVTDNIPVRVEYLEQ